MPHYYLSFADPKRPKGQRFLGGTVVEASLDDYVAACSDIFDRVRDKRIIHPNNQTLTEHVESARWRPVGDARRVFGHRVSAGDIDGIVAAALALWGAITKTAQPTGFALTIGGTE